MQLVVKLFSNKVTQSIISFIQNKFMAKTRTQILEMPFLYDLRKDRPNLMYIPSLTSIRMLSQNKIDSYSKLKQLKT